MSLEICSSCGTRVVRTAEATCPSCRRPFSSAAPNLFSETLSAQNPYASPNAAPGAKVRRNALFVPSLIFLVFAIAWELYVLAACALVFSPNGPFASMDSGMRFTTLSIYVLMLLANALFIPGAVAMLRMRPKWLAWTGCILGLVPMFGPCMGLTIPLAIWCLILLRRPDVDAQFPV